MDLTLNGKKSTSLIIGKALLFAGIQFSLGAFEMASKFSVRNDLTTQESLDNAVDALKDYVMIATFWTIGCCFIFYANYEIEGFIVALISNAVIIAWIYFSYNAAFKQAAKRYNLVAPGIFSRK